MTDASLTIDIPATITAATAVLAETAAASEPAREVDVGAIAWSRAGSGAAVVLLLPQSGGPVGIGPFVKGLAERFSVIRYDQRGTGGSAPPADPAAVTMGDRAREVLELLDALGIAQAHLFCHSTGCGIGIAFASAYPERLNRLVLTNPWAYADAHLTTMQNLRVAAARALNPQDYATFNASLLFPPDYRRAHAAGFAALAAAAARQYADQIASRLQAILAFDTRPLTPAINQPALVVTADDDQLMPHWFGQDIADSLPNARYVALRGGGHMLPETQTDRLLELVAGFLGSSV